MASTIEQLTVEMAQLHSLADSLPVPAWIAKEDGQLVYVNQCLLEYLQLSKSQLFGGGWQESIYPDDMIRLMNQWHAAVETGHPWTEHYRMRGSGDTTYRHFVLHATPVGNHPDKIVAWFGVNYPASISSLCEVDTHGQHTNGQSSSGLDSDAEQRRLAVNALKRSEKRFRAMVEHSLDAVALLDEKGRMTYVGPQGQMLMGYSPEEVLGMSGFQLVHAEDLEGLQQIFADLLKNPGALRTHSYRLLHKDKSWRWVIAIAKNLLHDPDVNSIVLNYRDVTEKRAAEEALKKSDERFRLVVQATNDAVYDWNIADGSIWWNENIFNLLQFDVERVQFTMEWWSDNLHPEDRKRIIDTLYAAIDSGQKTWSDEYRFRRGDGTYGYFFDRGTIAYDADGKPERMIGSMMDVTARKMAELELVRGAFHDTLTGLPNRASFLEHLERAVAHAGRRADYYFAVLFIDLDRFKFVNDGLGHAAGDELLIAVAKRFEESLRPGDLVARLGGDEFVILLDDIRDVEDATRVADRIEHKLGLPFELANQETFVTASIGIAVSSTGYKNPEDVLRDADTAMYRAKAMGKARYEIFDVEMHKRAIDRLQLESDMRRAMQREEFDLYYQPIVTLENHQIVGFEALMRWHHPQRGIVSPLDFIPIAEENGHIVQMGWWAIERACNWLKSCHDNLERGDLFVTVNISPRQFEQADFLSVLKALLARTQIPHSALKLEITESTMMDYSASTTELMLQLRALNVELYVDDFGTGHSSLSYLHRFPIDALKIDRSFVQQLETAEEGQEIVRAIVALGAAMKMKTVAEGVETGEQARVLLSLGCRFGQGYLYSRPVNEKAACELLHQQNPFAIGPCESN